MRLRRLVFFQMKRNLNKIKKLYNYLPSSHDQEVLGRHSRVLQPRDLCSQFSSILFFVCFLYSTVLLSFSPMFTIINTCGNNFTVSVKMASQTLEIFQEIIAERNQKRTCKSKSQKSYPWLCLIKREWNRMGSLYSEDLNLLLT